MKIKIEEINGKKYGVLDDTGKPVYVRTDGVEVGYDAPAAQTKIGELTREAADNRKAKETAEGQLSKFGDLDPEKARAAIETVGNLDAGQMKTADQVREITENARKAAEKQVEEAAKASAKRIGELETENGSLRSGWDGEKVSNAFASSKFISEKTVTPSDMMATMFGNRFKVEDGKLVPYGADGNKMYSVASPGEIASFEEGLEIMVNAYPHKDKILAGTNNSGSGAQPGTGSVVNGKPSITRKAFEAMDPIAKAKAARENTIINEA